MDAAAVGCRPRMAVAIAGLVEERLTKSEEQLPETNLRGRPCETITAGPATDALHEPSLPQHAQELGDIGHGKPLGLRDVGDAQGIIRSGPRQPQQAAQTVFFLGCDLHCLSPVSVLILETYT